MTLIAIAWLASTSACARVAPTPVHSPDAPVRALEAIVGEWQSDTVDDTAARSLCMWSPQGTAVICEQTITSPQGVHHTVNVYAADLATGEHFYYGIVHPGEPIAPTRLDVAGPLWTYGGSIAAPNGMYFRTINDFSSSGRYSWRTESSPDRTHWIVVRGGNSVLVRRAQ